MLVYRELRPDGLPFLVDDDEMFLVARSGTVAELRSTSGSRVWRARVTTVLTTHRIVVVLGAGVEPAAAAIYLSGAAKADLKQPVFGCPYLSLRSESAGAAGGGSMKLRVLFQEGGLSVFMPWFLCVRAAAALPPRSRAKWLEQVPAIRAGGMSALLATFPDLAQVAAAGASMAGGAGAEADPTYAVEATPLTRDEASAIRDAGVVVPVAPVMVPGRMRQRRESGEAARAGAASSGGAAAAEADDGAAAAARK